MSVLWGLTQPQAALTSSPAGPGRYWVGHQCRQSAASSSSLPAPHLPASSAHIPWLTAAQPARSLCPAKRESRTFSTLRLPPRTHKFHIHRQGRSHSGLCLLHCSRFWPCRNHQTLALKKGDLHPGESGGPAAPLTLRIWSSAVSICSSCCIFCRVTDWLFPFRSCMSVHR